MIRLTVEEVALHKTELPEANEQAKGGAAENVGKQRHRGAERAEVLDSMFLLVCLEG